jgi:hypothetical protein
MTEAPDQFAELTRRGHQVFAAAIRAWEEAARSLAEAARQRENPLPGVRASVDAAFDFAAQMLADQRDFTKTLMSVGGQVAAAAARRALPGSEPETSTASDARPAPDTGTPVPESDVPTTAPAGQSDVAPSSNAPVPTSRDDDSAGTRTPPSTGAVPKKAVPKKAVAKKAVPKKATSAPRKATSTPSAAPTPADTETDAKTTAAPAKKSAPSEATPAPPDGGTA